jgi:putative flippase GtrA
MKYDRRIVRFIIVGGACYSVSFLTLYLGTGILGWHYLISTALSFFSGTLIGWWLNRSWTFKAQYSGVLSSYIKYTSALAGSALVSFAIMALLVSGLRVHYLAANALTAGLMLLGNFSIHKNWSFRP